VEPLAAEAAAECLAAANEAKAAGNEHFKAGKWLWAADGYAEAIVISEPGRGTPEIRAARAIFFSNRAQARIKMELFEKAADDCNESLKLAPDNVKTLLRRSKAWEGQDKLIEAVDDMKKVVELSPVPANKKALAALEVAQKEQFEKQKEEMMGTLKDLGNRFLGNFGLSTGGFRTAPRWFWCGSGCCSAQHSLAPARNARARPPSRDGTDSLVAPSFVQTTFRCRNSRAVATRSISTRTLASNETRSGTLSRVLQSLQAASSSTRAMKTDSSSRFAAESCSACTACVALSGPLSVAQRPLPWKRSYGGMSRG
jgi:hypothetical protein